MTDDFPAMKPAGFDEDFVRFAAGCDDARQVDARDVRLHRLIIEGRVAFLLHRNADGGQECPIGMEAGQRQHKIVRQLFDGLRRSFSIVTVRGPISITREAKRMPIRSFATRLSNLGRTQGLMLGEYCSPR